jgi:hypothetical protein
MSTPAKCCDGMRWKLATLQNGKQVQAYTHDCESRQSCTLFHALHNAINEARQPGDMIETPEVSHPCQHYQPARKGGKHA